jgi:hypothetical protein
LHYDPHIADRERLVAAGDLGDWGVGCRPRPWCLGLNCRSLIRFVEIAEKTVCTTDVVETCFGLPLFLLHFSLSWESRAKDLP